MFWHLMLAHFLADYPLQSDWLVDNKRTWLASVIHIATHLGVMFVIVGPARLMIWPQLLVLMLFHFLMDWTKTSLGYRWPEAQSLQYVVDQLIHIGSIFLFATWIDRTLLPGQFPINGAWPVLAIGYLLATYVWFISERIFVRNNPKFLREVDDSFVSRMVARGVILSVVLLIRPGFEAFALVTLLPYTKQIFRLRSLVVDTLVALAMAILINLAI